MIRGLGIELAQARVDIAFLRARVEVVQSILSVITLHMQVNGQKAPGGYAFIPIEAIERLRTALGTTTG